jgi:hypothetical protein
MHATPAAPTFSARWLDNINRQGEAGEGRYSGGRIALINTMTLGRIGLIAQYCYEPDDRAVRISLEWFACRDGSVGEVPVAPRES